MQALNVFQNDPRSSLAFQAETVFMLIIAALAIYLALNGLTGGAVNRTVGKAGKAATVAALA
jgi:hypothetical protein